MSPVTLMRARPSLAVFLLGRVTKFEVTAHARSHRLPVSPGLARAPQLAGVSLCRARTPKSSAFSNTHVYVFPTRIPRGREPALRVWASTFPTASETGPFPASCPVSGFLGRRAGLLAAGRSRQERA